MLTSNLHPSLLLLPLTPNSSERDVKQNLSMEREHQHLHWKLGHPRRSIARSLDTNPLFFKTILFSLLSFRSFSLWWCTPLALKGHIREALSDKMASSWIFNEKRERGRERERERERERGSARKKIDRYIERDIHTFWSMNTLSTPHRECLYKYITLPVTMMKKWFTGGGKTKH